MENKVQAAIDAVNKSKAAFCKFISANDTGKTGAHQSGYYIPKSVVPMIFEEPRVKGRNVDRYVKIKWQGDFETDSRFIYYGTGTRNEYRLTRFGKRFPFLADDNFGDLLILAHIEGDYFEGYVLSSDDDIEDFFSAFGLSAADTNKIIDKKLEVAPEKKILDCFLSYVQSLKEDFPSTQDMAFNARTCYNNAYGISPNIITNKPDACILGWIDAEYQLFKSIENDRYSERIKIPFASVEELIEFANTVLNRRKSRAGKSLEHHLSAIFSSFSLKFQTQTVTEDNKKPDFLFPNAQAYLDNSYSADNLVFLASKTTCKDRWRQILNEADRIPEKHLFTLQQGISTNQLKEMYNYGVRLVVPKIYIKSFPETFREKILSLEGFIRLVQYKQNQ